MTDGMHDIWSIGQGGASHWWRLKVCFLWNLFHVPRCPCADASLDSI